MHDSFTSAKGKTNIVIEDLETAFPDLKFSISDDPNNQPTPARVSEVVYVPNAKIDLFDGESYLTNGINPTLYLKICDDGKNSEGINDEVRCIFKSVTPMLKPQKKLIGRVAHTGHVSSLSTAFAGDLLLKASLGQDPHSGNCGDISSEFIVIGWFDGFVYQIKYGDLIEPKPGDLFVKTGFYPPQDFGSFVMWVENHMTEDEITLNVKYKRSEDLPPSLATFDMTNPDGDLTKTIQLTGGDTYHTARYQLTDKIISGALYSHAQFSGVDLGPIGFGHVDAPLVNTIAPSVTSQMLGDEDLSSAEPEGNSNFDNNILPLIKQDIDNKINGLGCP